MPSKEEKSPDILRVFLRYIIFFGVLFFIRSLAGLCLKATVLASKKKGHNKKRDDAESLLMFCNFTRPSVSPGHVYAFPGRFPKIFCVHFDFLPRQKLNAHPARFYRARNDSCSRRRHRRASRRLLTSRILCETQLNDFQ